MRSRVSLLTSYRAPAESCLGPHQRVAAALPAGKSVLSSVTSKNTLTSEYLSARSGEPASFLSRLQAILRNSTAGISSSAADWVGEGAVVGPSKFDHGCRIDSRLRLQQLLYSGLSQDYRTDAKRISQKRHVRRQ